MRTEQDGCQAEKNTALFIYCEFIRDVILCKSIIHLKQQNKDK